MHDVFLREIDNNLSIIVYILMLKKKRYDLFFKAFGGQTRDSHIHLKMVKNFYYQAQQMQGMSGLHAVLNPDGKLCKNVYFLSIALVLDYGLEIIQKKIAYAPVETTDSEWLKQHFTESEQTLINNEKTEWITKIKSMKS